MLDSDDDEEDQSAGNAAVNEREAIANELFEGDEDTGEVMTKSVLCTEGSSPRPNHSLKDAILSGRQACITMLLILN